MHDAFPLTGPGPSAFPMIRRPSPERLLMSRIKREVAAYYGISPFDMTSRYKGRGVARPRQVAMYLSRRLTKASTPEIGRRFGNRDHTTVMHALSKVGELSRDDDEFAAELDELTAALSQAEAA